MLVQLITDGSWQVRTYPILSLTMYSKTALFTIVVRSLIERQEKQSLLAARALLATK